VKKYVEKRLLNMFLTEDEVLIGKRHWSKYHCEIFNFVDLCSGVVIVLFLSRPQPEVPNTSQWCHCCYFLR